MSSGNGVPLKAELPNSRDSAGRPARKGSLPEREPTCLPLRNRIFTSEELEAFTARVRAERLAAGLPATITAAEVLDRIAALVSTTA